jgi:tetratricopeptide (TPR) repeat protein
LAEAEQLNQQVNQLKRRGSVCCGYTVDRADLSYRREKLGIRHPSVANILTKLALLYEAQANYSQAEPLCNAPGNPGESAGQGASRCGRKSQQSAELYRVQGNYSQAEPLYQRSLAILEKVLGIEHPNVSHSLNNLALLYYAHGNYSQAEPLYQRSLAIREKVLGKEHPDVAQSLNNLAEVYRAQGTTAKPNLSTNALWQSGRKRWARRIPLWLSLSTIWHGCTENRRTTAKPNFCPNAP